MLFCEPADYIVLPFNLLLCQSSVMNNPYSPSAFVGK